MRWLHTNNKREAARLYPADQALAFGKSTTPELNVNAYVAPVSLQELRFAKSHTVEAVHALWLKEVFPAHSRLRRLVICTVGY